MTTAHRPTWKAAVGKANEGGWAAGGAVSTQISALDAPAHLALKVRKGSQIIKDRDSRQAALKKSLLELEAAEKGAKNRGPALFGRRGVDPAIEQAGKMKLLKQTADVDTTKLKEKYDDSDIDDGGGVSAESDNQSNSGNTHTKGNDSDGNSDLDASDSDDDDDDNSDDDDDDEAALQAELTKIRAEREAAKDKVEQEAAAEENAKNEQAALLGNPLLKGGDDGTNTMGKRRRWNDDVVFRNQAKGEPVPKKRFINDTVRNDFHKRFLHKFIH
jgi:protein CWC15